MNKNIKYCGILLVVMCAIVAQLWAPKYRPIEEKIAMNREAVRQLHKETLQIVHRIFATLEANATNSIVINNQLQYILAVLKEKGIIVATTPAPSLGSVYETPESSPESPR